MDIIIKENYEEMSKYAADKIAEYIRSKPNCVQDSPPDQHQSEPITT